MKAFYSTAAPLRSSFAIQIGCLWAAAVFLQTMQIYADTSSSRTLEDVITNVRTNEQLYKRMEIKHRVNYGLGERSRIAQEQFSGKSGAGHQLIESSTVTARTINQGNLHYLDHKRLEHLQDGKPIHVNTLQGYDGGTTRIAERSADGGFGNIHENSFIDGRRLEPHLFLLEESFALPFNSLSDYMAATKYRKQHLRWKVLGDADIDGIRCIKMSATGARTVKELDADSALWRNLYWIAIDRNYLLMKYECYRSWQKGLEPAPCSSGEVVRFKEVSPGLWFPMKASQTTYDPTVLYGEGRKVIMASVELEVDSVKLDPNYPEAFFRDIDMPAGAVVYRLKNGKTTSKYKTAAPVSTTSERPRYIFIIVGVIGVVGVLSGVLLWRRIKS